MQLAKFPYHTKLTNFFKKQEKTWDWFSKDNVQEKQYEDYKKELLKNTYRLSENSEEEIYKLIHLIKEKLGITKSITVYQELNNSDANASVFSFGDEVHIVISGNLIKRLSEKELLTILAHELSHVLFYDLENGDFEITNRIVKAIASDEGSSPVMIETARLYQLYIELFCDRGALFVLNDLDTVIETLIKVNTGLETVSAKNYLKQAHEIFSQENEGTNQLTHPETFIRARALEVYHKKEKESEIEQIIDMNWGLNKLDVFKQKELQLFTKKMLQIITKPKWIRTENVFTHCRNFLPKFKYSDTIFIDKDFEDFFLRVDDTIKEYFSYILLDFCFMDSSLDKAPIGHAFQIAEALEFDKTFKQIMKKELKTTVKSLNDIIEKGVKEVSAMGESEEESILENQ